MSAIIDFYEHNDSSTADPIRTDGNISLGQTFKGNGNTISHCKIYLRKSNSPTGNYRIKIYEHTGTYGSSGKPTGSPILQSTDQDVSLLTASLVLTTINFDGTYKTTAGTNYVLTVENESGTWLDGVSGLDVGIHDAGTANRHSGNYCFEDITNTWDVGSPDVKFYIYSVEDDVNIGNKKKNISVGSGMSRNEGVS